MIHPPPFPISIEQLDSATLAAALAAPVMDFESQRIGADRGMLGEIFLVRPEYAVGASGPEAVICKFAALRDQALASAQRGGTHERELRCYDELLVDTAVTVPECYGAWYDPDTAHFLLVQAAVQADATVDQVAGISASHVELVIAQAAELHRSRWNDPALSELAWLPRLDDPRRVTNLTTLATNGWQPLCDLLGDELSAAEQQLGASFPQRLETALQSLAAMPSTLVHSDLRADNLLFSTDTKSVTLIDWQGAGIGPGSFDLAYLISHSLTVNDRRTHEARLIARYLDILRTGGIEQSLDDFMAGYALSLHFGLVIACALPVIGDPTEPRVRALASSMARRSIEALRDHNQLWV